MKVSVTGALNFIEIHIGKEGKKKRNYHIDPESTSAYKKRIMGATKGLGKWDEKGARKDCFLFDSWFSLEMLSESVMDVGADMIGMVKTNTKGLCKETIENLTKDWTGGS